MTTTTKKRSYHLFRKEETEHSEPLLIDGETYYFKELPLESFDRFSQPIVQLAIPINTMANIGAVLRYVGLVDSQENFYKQCKDVIAVPEKHQNESGKEGKLNFQAYFHDVPHSMTSINDRAIVVLSLHPYGEPNSEGLRPYRLAGYVHANEFEFAPDKTKPDHRLPGYYYNMLRISEYREDGQKVYRRSGIFSLMFAVLLDLVNQFDVHFVYATMGKENEKIHKALIKLCDFYNKQHDVFQVTSHSKLCLFYGRKKAYQQLRDITDDKTAMEQLYALNMEAHGDEVFCQYPDFNSFYHIFKRITAYSKSSRAWGIYENNTLVAGSVAVNWGDYFALLLDNPKGIFRLLEKLALTEKMLYPWMTAGPTHHLNTLYRGMAHHYYHQHGVKMLLFNEPEGDKHASIKRSIIKDPFDYFVIYDRPEQYKQFVDHSKKVYGHRRIFLELPMV